MRSVMLLGSIVLIASAGCGGDAESAAVPQARPLSKDEFVREFCRRVDDVDPTVSALPAGEDRVTLQYGEEQRQTVLLGEAFEDYLVAIENIDLILNRVVDANLSIIRHAREAHVDISRILPAIVHRQRLDDLPTSPLASDSASPEAALYFEPLNDQLVVAYYQRNDRREPRYLSHGNVASLDIPREKLRELAVQNLHALLPPATLHNQYGITGVAAGDRYESCLLLLDELWTNEFFSVQGNIVVAVPSRNAVLVTGSENQAGIEQLAIVAREGFAASKYPVTDQLFVRRDGKWVLWEP
jgi:uncharacterized protein YtpQ (UPF0354 family)